MLVGVYLFTPLLRVMVTHANRKLIKYLLIVWLLGTVLTPIPAIFGYQLSVQLFIVPMWAGYFVLGLYLLEAKVRRSTLLACFLLGLVSTAIGTYVMAATFGGPRTFFFHDYSSPTLILTAVSLFLLFNTFQQPPNQTETRHPKIHWLLKKISENTLPLYLFHVMIIESIQRGYFGFIISGTVMNSIYEVPLLAVITLFICLAVIIPLKKIPIVKRLIG
jgi:surface polysaccharide O-acyltransferase-like enzyme